MSARPTIVGGFILGALALGVAAILLFGGMRFFATTTRAVVFFDESVAGLSVGAPVTFHGVQVGSVQSIAIRFSADTMTARVPVFLELDASRITWEDKQLNASGDYERLIKAGLRAQLAQQSIVTGLLRVDLDFRPDKPAVLVGAVPGVPEIPAVPSEFAELRDQITQLSLRELVVTAQRSLVSLERLTEHVDQALTPLAATAHRTADAAVKTLPTTNDAIRQVQGEPSTSLRDLDALLVDARHQLNARGGQLSRTLATAGAATRRAQALLDSLNALTEPNSPVRGDLEAAVRDLAASASSLRNFVKTVERNPNALLVGRGGGQ